MTVVLALIDALHAANVGVKGSTLFLSTMPASIVRGAMFRPYGGLADPELTELRHTKFQVVVRDRLFQDASSFAESIRSALIIRQKELGGYYVYQCLPRDEPLPLGSEGSGVFTFVINFDVRWRQI